MNFQTIRQIKGQKDEKGYAKKLDMFGILNEIGGAYLNTNQTPCSKCVITDDLGEKHTVIIMKDVPATNLLNTRQGFSIYSFDGNYKGNSYIGYSGFWVANPRQNVSQNTQNTPQNAPQSTNSNNSVDMLTNIYGVLCRIQELIEKETDFRKKYDLGQDPDFPTPPGTAQDETIPYP